MAPQNFPRPPKAKSPSPADRSAELAETQRRLKREAAERRERAAAAPAKRPPRKVGKRG